MNTLYERNGLIFWDQEAIRVRRTMEDYFVLKLEQNLRSQNGAFFFLQVEAPIGPCRVEPSDRVPDYAEWTQDVIHEASNMEACSMSKRKDFDLASVLEVAIGTDRCTYHFLNKNAIA